MEEKPRRTGADLVLVEPRHSGLGESGEIAFIAGDGLIDGTRREVALGLWLPAVPRVIAMLLELQLSAERTTDPHLFALPAQAHVETSTDASIQLVMRMPGGAELPFSLDRTNATELLSELAGRIAS